MLEDERRCFVHNPIEAGNLGEHHIPEMVGVAHRDLDQEVVATAHEKHRDRLRKRPQPLENPIDNCLALRTDPHGNERLQSAAERPEVDISVVAADHPAPLKIPRAIQRGRRRKPDGLCKGAVGLPRI